MLKLATKFVPDHPSFFQAWSAGFRYAEFWLSAELLKEVKKIVAAAKHYPFQYVPHFPNKKNDADSVKQAVKLYQELDCQTIVIHQPMIDQWKKEFLEIDSEISFAVENHRLTPKEFWNWAEENPGLNLDVEHLWKFTLEDAPLSELFDTLEKFLSRFGKKLNHVHLPGYVPGEEEHRPMYCNQDFVQGVWERLEEIDYQGLVVSEVNEEFQNPYNLQMDVLLFEHWEQKK